MKIRRIEKKNNDEYSIKFENGNIAFWGRDFLKDRMRKENDIDNYIMMVNVFNS